MISSFSFLRPGNPGGGGRRGTRARYTAGGKEEEEKNGRKKSFLSTNGHFSLSLSEVSLYVKELLQSYKQQEAGTRGGGEEEVTK